jgi:hypothetical protein
MSYGAGNGTGIGQTAYFWTSASRDGDYPDALEIQLYADDPVANMDIFHKYIHLSVRCINKSVPLNSSGNRFSGIFLTPGKYRYLVTQTISGFESPADTVIISVNSHTDPPECTNINAVYGQPIPPFFAEGENIKWYKDFGLTQLVGFGNTFNTGESDLGFYEYYVTQTKGCESEPVKVSLGISIGTVIKNGNDIGIIQIFPNPNSGPINIRFMNKESCNVQISVLNLEGKVLVRKKLKQIYGNEIIPLDLSSLSNGTYFVHIVADGVSLYKKIIIIN